MLEDGGYSFLKQQTLLLTQGTGYSHAKSILMVSVPEPSELETVQATTMLSISLVRLGIRNTDSSADQRLDRPGKCEMMKVEYE